MMSALRRWTFLAGLGLMLGGCVEAPVLPGAPGTGTAAPGAGPMMAGAPAAGPAAKPDAQITNTLVELIERKNKSRVDLSNVQGTPLGEILSVGSPIGFQLRNRFLNIGVPLSEAASRNADPVFREKLIELARWDNNGETRANALVALAGLHDVAHFDIFREALVHLDPAVRFAALEALIIWEHPEKSMSLLSMATEREREPILRVYAASGLARMGDPSGLLRLRAFLDDPSWLVRAMAGRYIGDYGAAEDYRLMTSRIGREGSNDFVVAEFCIAALKLFPKTVAK